MKDRQTMARRVRGYVTTSKGEGYGSSTTAGRATSAERKALATMGRRGGQSTAQRLKNDPSGDYAQLQRQKRQAANAQRKLRGNETRGQAYALFTSVLAQTGKAPTGAELGAEVGITRQQANRHLKALRDIGLI